MTLSEWFAFVRSHRPISVWLSEHVVLRIIHAATRAHPKETGGIIVGVLSRGKPWITDAIEIPSTKASSYHYEVPGGERQKIVTQLRTRDARLGYLGEWHSHIADVGLSSDDESSMRSIVRDDEAARPHSVLIIVRRRSSGYVLDASAWSRRDWRPVQFVLAGPLNLST